MSSLQSPTPRKRKPERRLTRREFLYLFWKWGTIFSVIALGYTAGRFIRKLLLLKEIVEEVEERREKIAQSVDILEGPQREIVLDFGESGVSKIALNIQEQQKALERANRENTIVPVQVKLVPQPIIPTDKEKCTVNLENVLSQEELIKRGLYIVQSPDINLYVLPSAFKEDGPLNTVSPQNPLRIVLLDSVFVTPHSFNTAELDKIRQEIGFPSPQETREALSGLLEDFFGISERELKSEFLALRKEREERGISQKEFESRVKALCYKFATYRAFASLPPEIIFAFFATGAMGSFVRKKDFPDLEMDTILLATKSPDIYHYVGIFALPGNKIAVVKDIAFPYTSTSEGWDLSPSITSPQDLLPSGDEIREGPSEKGYVYLPNLGFAFLHEIGHYNIEERKKDLPVRTTRPGKTGRMESERMAEAIAFKLLVKAWREFRKTGNPFTSYSFVFVNRQTHECVFAREEKGDQG